MSMILTRTIAIPTLKVRFPDAVLFLHADECDTHECFKTLRLNQLKNVRLYGDTLRTRVILTRIGLKLFEKTEKFQ
jgi:hypothetical protein